MNNHNKDVFTKAYFVVRAVIKHVKKRAGPSSKSKILPQKLEKAKEGKMNEIQESMRVHHRKVKI